MLHYIFNSAILVGIINKVLISVPESVTNATRVFISKSLLRIIYPINNNKDNITIPKIIIKNIQEYDKNVRNGLCENDTTETSDK